MPKAEIKDAEVKVINEPNLSLEVEQRVPFGAALSVGPIVGEKENFLPASYLTPEVLIEHKDGSAKTITGIVRTDR